MMPTMTRSIPDTALALRFSIGVSRRIYEPDRVSASCCGLVNIKDSSCLISGLEPYV